MTTSKFDGRTRALTKTDRSKKTNRPRPQAALFEGESSEWERGPEEPFNMNKTEEQKMQPEQNQKIQKNTTRGKSTSQRKEALTLVCYLQKKENKKSGPGHSTRDKHQGQWPIFQLASRNPKDFVIRPRQLKTPAGSSGFTGGGVKGGSVEKARPGGGSRAAGLWEVQAWHKLKNKKCTKVHGGKKTFARRWVAA